MKPPEWCNEKFLRTLGLVLWIGLFVAAAGTLAVRGPDKRTVTSNYRAAAERWWSGEPLYGEGQHGYLYPPQGAILYSPFTLFPKLYGEILWRLAGIGLFGWGAWRLSVAAHPRGRGTYFGAVSAGSLSLAAGCAMNGQMNLPIAGAFMLAAADAAGGRWWRTTLWLALSVAMKPIALPVLLVAWVIHRPLWFRVPLGVLGVLALPFLHTDPAYVVEQLRASVEKMAEAGSPGAGAFSDFKGMLGSAGIVLPEALVTLIRAAFAPVTLAASWLALWFFGRERGSIAATMLPVGYLMLFNPRTEGNTYVTFAPFVAVVACWVIAEERRRIAGALLVGALIVLAFSHELTPRKNVWMRPLAAGAILAYVAARIAGRRPFGGGGAAGSAPAIAAPGGGYTSEISIPTETSDPGGAPGAARTEP